MAIRDINTKPDNKPFIDLSGQDGGAFQIIGTAKIIAKQLPALIPNINDIVEEMQSGDYENLVAVFEREFGEYIDIYR